MKQKKKSKRRPYEAPRIISQPIFERMALACGQKPGSAECAASRRGTIT